MKKVPISRFRREIRKWIRNQEAIEITSCGESLVVFIPADSYNKLLNLIKNSS